MAKYRKKPVVIEAITWDEFIEHGRKICILEGREHNIINGMRGHSCIPDIRSRMSMTAPTSSPHWRARCS